MPVDDPLFLIVSILFGGLMGYGLGRRREDRVPVLWSTGLATVAGVACWIAWALLDDPGETLATAAVALTLGGGASLLLALIASGRARPTPLT